MNREQGKGPHSVDRIKKYIYFFGNQEKHFGKNKNMGKVDLNILIMSELGFGKITQEHKLGIKSI